MTNFPTLLQQVLDAGAKLEACDARLHPRISSRLDMALREARKELRETYPQVEDWLFGFPYRHQAERITELQRLAAEHAALVGIANPAAVPELVRTALDARDHMQELREAWERGIITEHDGHGGRRSNRNVDVLVRVRAAIAALDKKEE